MRNQPLYASSTRQTRFPRNAGQARRGAERWIMRSSNGSEWVTEGFYHEFEVKQFLCAEPIRPIDF